MGASVCVCVPCAGGNGLRGLMRKGRERDFALHVSNADLCLRYALCSVLYAFSCPPPSSLPFLSLSFFHSFFLPLPLSLSLSAARLPFSTGSSARGRADGTRWDAGPTSLSPSPPALSSMRATRRSSRRAVTATSPQVSYFCFLSLLAPFLFSLSVSPFLLSLSLTASAIVYEGNSPVVPTGGYRNFAAGNVWQLSAFFRSCCSLSFSPFFYRSLTASAMIFESNSPIVPTGCYRNFAAGKIPRFAVDQVPFSALVVFRLRCVDSEQVSILINPLVSLARRACDLRLHGQRRLSRMGRGRRPGRCVWVYCFFSLFHSFYVLSVCFFLSL